MALSIVTTPAAASLAPGFRFHPTDEELVRYYLRRKVCGKSFRFDAISDVDVYKVEPWDLPDLSKLRTRDLEWYFFSVLDKKYGNGCRTNRATEKGYWKTTGKDRAVYHRSQQVGMKKTLVYHSGRAPKGARTNWVMHEYRLIDQELQKAGILQDAFVLCRIFQKSGSGPKNGEKYGAPFVEEEWEDDETIFVPKPEVCTEVLPFDNDSGLDPNEIDEIFNTAVEDGPVPLSIDCCVNFNPADVSTIDPLNSNAGASEFEPQFDQNEGSTSFKLPVQTGLDTESVNCGYMGEPINDMNFGNDYLLDEPFFDANGDFLHDENLFFQADDLKNDVDTDYSLDMLNEYTSSFNNPDVDNFYFQPDENKNTLLESSNVNGGTYQVTDTTLQPFDVKNDNFAFPKEGNQDQETDTYSFLKKASYMLGNVHAPPAFASEFPTKYMASAASLPSSSVNGMIHFGNVSFNGGAVDLSLGKHTQFNIVLSFGLGQREVRSATSDQVAKANSTASRSWFYCAMVWILVLSLSFKIGSLVCSRSFLI